MANTDAALALEPDTTEAETTEVSQADSLETATEEMGQALPSDAVGLDSPESHETQDEVEVSTSNIVTTSADETTADDAMAADAISSDVPEAADPLELDDQRPDNELER